MTTMVQYFSNKAESFPQWLAQRDYSLRNFFGNRTIFYPGSGDDGHPLAIFNSSHSAHCYFYVDQSYSAENLEERLGYQPAGYFPILDRQYSAEDLRRESIRPLSDADLRQFTAPPRMTDGCSARSYRSLYDSLLAAVDSSSAVRLLIYERKPEYDESHGAMRFAIFCLGMEARTAYEWFYGTMFRGNPPYAILLQDHGTGGDFAKCTVGVGEFGDCNGRLYIAARKSGLPEFLIVAENTNYWPGYNRIPNVIPDAGGMHDHERKVFQMSRNAEGSNQMSRCEAIGCNRQGSKRVRAERNGEGRVFNLCMGHHIIFEHGIRYGGLYADDGRGWWRPVREIYSYEIGDGTRSGDRSGYTHRSTFAEAIEEVERMAGNRPWKIYSTVLHNEGQLDESPIRDELLISSANAGDQDNLPRGTELWRKIEAAVRGDSEVKLNPREAEMLWAAGILSEIKEELYALDRLDRCR